MTHDHLKTFIDSAYEHAVEITPETKGVVRDAVDEVLGLLDRASFASPRSATATGSCING